MKKTGNFQLLATLILVQTVAPLITSQTSGKHNYDVKLILLIGEGLKFIASCVLESKTLRKQGFGNKNTLFHSFHQHIWLNPLDFYKLSIPALLYLVQNILNFFAVPLLYVPLFMVVQQSKLVMTALLSVILLRKSYGCVQWLSIISLCMGTSLCLLSSMETGNVKQLQQQGSTMSRTQMIGLVTVLLANLSNASAGIYFEYMLKGVQKRPENGYAKKKDSESLMTANYIGVNDQVDKPYKRRSTVTNMKYERKIAVADIVHIRNGPDKNNSNKEETVKRPSVWMRNIQLSFFTICLIFIDYCVNDIEDGKEMTPLFGEKLDLFLMLYIALYAYGGLVIASVINRADNVQKGLCMSISVVLSSGLSVLIEGRHDMDVTGFMMGACLALGGCFVFANPTIIKFKRNHLVFHCLVLMILAGKYLRFQPKSTLIKAIATPIPKSIEKVTDNDIRENLYVHVRTVSNRENPDGGGPRVLFNLLETIAARNIPTSDAVSTGGLCPDEKFLAEHLSSNKTLVFIYPEVDVTTCDGPGNRVHLRWILAAVGMCSPLNVTDSWGKEDMVFHYNPMSAPKPADPSNALVLLDTPAEGDGYDNISPGDFYNKKGRSGVVWMLRKAKIIFKALDFKFIRDDFFGSGMKSTQMEDMVATDFFKYEYFVTYDPYSYFVYMAAMCGTVPIVIPLEGLSKEEWLLSSYVGDYYRVHGGDVPGVAYGTDPEEIEHARVTMKFVRGYLIKVKTWSKEITVPRALRDVYRYGKGERNINHFEGALLVRDAYPPNFAAEATSHQFTFRLSVNSTGYLDKATEVLTDLN